MEKLNNKSNAFSDSVSLLINRFSSLFANGFLILVLPHYLDAVSQGYYFSFLGLAALQVAFDFGMSQTIMQMVMHSFAISDDEKVRALIAHSNRWSKKIAIFFIATLIPGGLYYFSHSANTAPFGWTFIWIALVLSTGVNLFFSSRLTAIEGLGGLSSVAKLRTYQNFIGVALIFFALYFGAGLFAVIIMPVLSGLFTYVWLKHIYVNESLNGDVCNLTELDIKEIFGLQWKIGLSWVCGYAVQQSITPIIFKEQGAIVAGQFGLTLALFNAISIVGLSLVTATIPQLASHVSLFQREKLISLFKKAMFYSVACTIILVFLLFMILKFSNIIPPNRVLSGASLYCLAIVCLANAVIFPIAMLLRAHKEEPTLMMGIFTGLLLIGFILSISEEGVSMIAGVYAGVTLLIALPWTCIIFFRFIKRYYE